MKRIYIDTNWFRESPMQPYIPEDQTSGLTPGEQVLAVDVDNEWIGTVVRDAEVVHEQGSIWYIMLDRNSWRDLNFPPFDMDNFRVMSSYQAFDHSQWFYKQKTERLNMLFRAYKYRGGKEELDFSIRSLLYLWEWFVANRKETKVVTDGKRYDEHKIRNVIDWTQEMMGLSDEQRLPSGTAQLMMDVAIYFAEVCIRQREDIHWSIIFSEEANGYRFKPMLSSKQYQYFNPFRFIYEIDQLRLVDNSYGNELLMVCYEILIAKLSEHLHRFKATSVSQFRKEPQLSGGFIQEVSETHNVFRLG